MPKMRGWQLLMTRVNLDNTPRVCIDPLPEFVQSLVSHDVNVPPQI